MAGLGTGLRDLARTEETVLFYVCAFTLQPSAADHHSNRANMYNGLSPAILRDAPFFAMYMLIISAPRIPWVAWLVFENQAGLLCARYHKFRELVNLPLDRFDHKTRRCSPPSFYERTTRGGQFCEQDLQLKLGDVAHSTAGCRQKSYAAEPSRYRRFSEQVCRCMGWRWRL